MCYWPKSAHLEGFFGLTLKKFPGAPLGAVPLANTVQRPCHEHTAGLVKWHGVPMFTLIWFLCCFGAQDVAKCLNEVKRDSERMTITKDIMGSLVEYRVCSLCSSLIAAKSLKVHVLVKLQSTPKPLHTPVFLQSVWIYWKSGFTKLYSAQYYVVCNFILGHNSLNCAWTGVPVAGSAGGEGGEGNLTEDHQMLCGQCHGRQVPGNGIMTGVVCESNLCYQGP